MLKGVTDGSQIVVSSCLVHTLPKERNQQNKKERSKRRMSRAETTTTQKAAHSIWRLKQQPLPLSPPCTQQVGVAKTVRHRKVSHFNSIFINQVATRCLSCCRSRCLSQPEQRRQRNPNRSELSSFVSHFTAELMRFFFVVFCFPFIFVVVVVVVVIAIVIRGFAPFALSLRAAAALLCALFLYPSLTLSLQSIIHSSARDVNWIT